MSNTMGLYCTTVYVYVLLIMESWFNCQCPKITLYQLLPKTGIWKSIYSPIGILFCGKKLKDIRFKQISEVEKTPFMSSLKSVQKPVQLICGYLFKDDVTFFSSSGFLHNRKFWHTAQDRHKIKIIIQGKGWENFSQRLITYMLKPVGYPFLYWKKRKCNTVYQMYLTYETGI